MEGEAPGHGAGRRALSWGAVVALPLLFFAVLEGLARFFGPAGDDPHLALVGEPVFFERFERQGAPWLRVAHAELYGGRDTEFPLHKPHGGLRIFTVGGSASAGWPHPPEEIYGAYLRTALRHALPGRPVEVIDASAHAYAAYRVRLVARRLLDFDPDLLVLYSGNNEFLEPRTYLPRSALPEGVRRLAFVRALRSLLLRTLKPEASLSAATREHVAFEQASKLERRVLELRRDPVQYAELVRHYEASIRGIVAAAAERGVPTVVVTVPVNQRDWKPNVSLEPEAEARARWEEHYRAGRVALLDGDVPEASRQLRRASEVAPHHAETHFWLGRALEQGGDPAAATAAYRAALDLDHNPFRAVTRFNQLLRQIAEERPEAHLADAENAFAVASAPLAPGFDLFLDYVHPRVSGNRLVARTVYGTIARAGLSNSELDPGSFHLEPSGYDEVRDRSVQQAVLLLFAMMHQTESIVAKTRSLAAVYGESWRFPASLNGLYAEVLEHERQRLRGEPVDARAEQRVRGRLDRFYDEHYPQARAAVAR